MSNFEEVFAGTLATNFPTIVVVIAASFLLWKKGDGVRLFMGGLFVVLAVGLFVVPFSEYMWGNHEALMSESVFATAVISLAFSVIHSIGLGMCVYAFYKQFKE